MTEWKDKDLYQSICAGCVREDCTWSNNGHCKYFLPRLEVPEWVGNLEYNDDGVIHYRNRSERRLYERNLKKKFKFKKK